MEEGRCRSCGAPVVLIYGATKRMICNPKILTVITDRGLIVHGRESHFSTCPNADKWRTKKMSGENYRPKDEVEGKS